MTTLNEPVAVQRTWLLCVRDRSLRRSVASGVPGYLPMHLRNLYAEHGVHSRAEAVESARAQGLLAPSARPPVPA
jgi:hypothetical protein